MLNLKYILPVFSFGNPGSCTYCGDPADCRDHVIPVSAQNDKRDSRGNRVGSQYGPWCWSCSDCNRRLSSHRFTSFQQRCQWISDRLSIKALPVHWHLWELQKLDFGLRSYIVADRMRRLWFRSRSDYYQSREFYLGLEKLVFEIGRLDPQVHSHRFIKNFFSGIASDTKETLYKN